ncbi:uncharacterized protein LOC125543390 [Triticum urartu]|uniref:J domain-containing protein n=1 Tax=Triticum urartu TaxID=4572 RepID=A0A8R7PJZ4_TRIUA|nr:uncharacterized protein LOC125539940 [Triticum urartu]XP_048559447.1 uncharacterized protein LOC125539940 [Triticum urartu]XP_048562671.1 uncharacterized protein LOC125543390 [Triticum urartu]
MGKGDREKEAKRRRRGRSSKRSRNATPSSDSDSSPSPDSSPSRSPGPRSRSNSKPEKSSSSRRRRHHHKSSGRSRSSRDDDRHRHRQRRRDERARHSSDGSDLSGSGSDDSGWMEEAQEIVRGILSEFPAITSELRQLLQMIDSGEGIDISGISDKPLVKRLKKLFRSLKLKESANGAYLLSAKGVPTLDVVGPVLEASAKHGNDPNETVAQNRQQVPLPNFDVQNKDDIPPEDGGKVDREEDTPIKRVIGPAMPSRELLAAAAEMTEALRCRDAELEADDGFLIGPPPPAMVAEAASANEAERFEEVTRILGADADALYDVLGINWKMSSDNIKKRYWKLSLLVHPDKCPHPSAQEAFVKLNNAFKDLQDPQKRGAIDEKIQKKEEMEQFEVELKAMREAAEWRRLQGISLEGDEELLAVPKQPEAPPTRDEWMTTLPPERKAGVPMHSTTAFSMNGKEGRGDTSAWTDSPLDRAQKAQQNYLEAYNKAKAIADGHEEQGKSANASLVDKYNSSKRSVSLVQKHRESKKEKKKQKQQRGKEEWEENHPWKPWDREKDLTAGRQNVALDPENTAQGLSSRFSSGAVQRNFL